MPRNGRGEAHGHPVALRQRAAGEGTRLRSFLIIEVQDGTSDNDHLRRSSFGAHWTACLFPSVPNQINSPCSRFL